MHLVYFANDLNDSAIARRVTMFRQGGATVALAGFHRQPEPPGDVAGGPVAALGRTRDARLVNRIGAVARHAATARRLTPLLDGADLVVARNLEMLVIAARVIAASGRPIPLVYELLDVHRLLAGEGFAARLLRRLERWGIGRSAAIIVSSPAFARDHLERRYDRLPPVILIENKVFAPPSRLSTVAAPPPGPPWRIGWFGVLRCRESLDALAAIAARLGERVEIDLRGVIGVPIADRIDAVLARHPNIRFHGRYRNPDDLGAIYRQVHFAWAIDYYEQGLNSVWLLPNRLYEGCGHGAVPIAVAGVETAAWLERHDMGLIVDGVTQVGDALDSMDAPRFAAMRATIAAAPRSLFFTAPAECIDLIDRLAALPARR